MRAAVYRTYRSALSVEDVPEPGPSPDGVVLRVGATGLCRSDWHGWMGHDDDVTVPHVPGHEFAGEVVAVGAEVRGWRTGDRVTVPFVCGCGVCEPCRAGDTHVCEDQVQPGVTHPGAFAEYVAVPRADLNLVRLPDAMPYDVAASLGCRFSTAFRAVVDQGAVRPGEWVAVHGCGGVGLSAVMVAVASGARVVAVDVDAETLALATSLGAAHTVDASQSDASRSDVSRSDVSQSDVSQSDVSQGDDVAAAVRSLTGGGAHVSLDAVGSTATCLASIGGLRTRGRHVQVGLMVGDHATPPVPMGLLHAREVALLGSHGMPAHAYPRLLALVAEGRVDPSRLVTRRLTLTEGAASLPHMADGPARGMAVVTDLAG